MLALGLLVVAILLARLLAVARRRLAPAPAAILAALLVAVLVGALLLAPDAFQLRKFLGACAMPPGLIWLALIALTWWLAERRQRGPALAAAALTLFYTAAGSVWLGAALAGWLQRPYPPVDLARLEPFDAVLVLGGGVDTTPAGEGALSLSGERVAMGARLVHAGKAALLFASGPSLRLEDGSVTTYPALTRRIWRDLGVAEERIAELVGPRTTAEEIAAFAPLARQRGFRRVAIVTSAWHLRRAMGLCHRAGLAATPIPAGYVTQREPDPRWLVPQHAGFTAVQIACWELLGQALGL